MSIDLNDLHNKFHILSVGLRRLRELIVTGFEDHFEKRTKLIDKLIKESDEGIELITKETNK